DGNERSPALGDRVLEVARRLAKRGRGARLFEGDGGCRGKRVLEALEVDEVTAIVDDRDGAGGAEAPGFCACRSSDSFGAVERERLPGHGLGEGWDADGGEGQRGRESHEFFADVHDVLGMKLPCVDGGPL